jgi:hypothetical protein
MDRAARKKHRHSHSGGAGGIAHSFGGATWRGVPFPGVVEGFKFKMAA